MRSLRSHRVAPCVHSLALGLLLICGLLPAAALAAGAPVQAPLVVACPDDIPPYGFRDAGGRLAGLLPDFWRLFARSSGVPVTLRAAGSAEALALLDSGAADVHAGMPREAGEPEGGADRHAFSRPLFDQELGVFAAGDGSAAPGGDGQALERSRGLTLGLVRGEPGAALLSANFPGMRQRIYADQDSLAAALTLGRVDLAAGPALALRQRLRVLAGDRGFRELRSYPGEALHAVVRAGDTALLARIDAGLAAMPPHDVSRLLAGYTARGVRLPGWGVGSLIAALALAACLLVLRRARLLRKEAEARGRETDLLRDGLLAEMARRRKTQDLLLSAIEQSPSGIIIAYADRRSPPVLNTHALKILGMPEPPPHGELPDHHQWRVYTPAGKMLSKNELPLALALRGQSLVNAEFRLALADGVERWILTNAAPVRDAQDAVRAAIVVFHDITASRLAERELARFKFFLEAGVEEVYLLRPDGVMAYVNEAVARSLGLPRVELLERPATVIAPDLTPAAVNRLLLEVRMAPVTRETVQHSRDGRKLLKELKVFYMRFGDEEYVCGFGRDITEQSRMARELDSTRALFAASLEQAPWGIVIGDAATGNVSIANPEAARLLGLDQEGMVGQCAHDPVPGWCFSDAEGHLVPPERYPLALALAGEETRDLEVRFQLENGPERWLLANAAPVRGPDGEIVAAILVMADITSRKRMENQLVYKALHDSLTGLPNRELCLRRLKLMLDHACVTGRGFAVAFMDLDRFKMLNDSLGHPFGDRVLLEVGRRLSRGVAGRGEVGRFGGDEFVLLVNRAEGAQDARRVIDEALAGLRAPMLVDGQEVRLTASVGVVAGPGVDCSTPENILQNADLAMHRAKDSGRDSVRLFDPGMLRHAQELLALDADIRRGLERDEFVVFYQPIMAADGRTLLGFEALARWRCPARGLVPPHAFIPHAEDSGLIVPLGEQILRKACAGMTAWRDRFACAKRLTLAVNLSARQFLLPDIVDTVRQVLRETALPSARLKLELTESTLMGDPETALSAMRRLKSLGLALAIDDFGTGYSSLAYLQRFPVDILKIDRSFVRDLPSGDADSHALVRAIAALAGSLRLRVVAEGVESREQLDVLAGLGCQAMQGFLFHPPLPADAVEELLLEIEEREAAEQDAPDVRAAS